MECRETVPSGQKTNHTCSKAVILVALVVYISCKTVAPRLFH